MPFNNSFLSFGDLRSCKVFFLFLFFISLFFLANSSYGVINWIFNPRVGYQLHRIGNGHLYALATSFLSVSYIFSLLTSSKSKSIAITITIYIFYAYFLGSKGTILSFFAAGLIFLWFAKSKYLTYFIFYGLPIIFTILLFNLYLSYSEDFNIVSIVSYFDHYKNASDYYNAYFLDEIPLFNGEMLLTSWWKYIPRALFDTKPFTYGPLLVNEYFFPGQAELTNTPAFAGAVDSFADFGIFGVVLYSFFSSEFIVIAFCSFLLFNYPGINFYKVSILMCTILFVFFGPAFGVFFQGPIYILLIIFIVFLIFFIKIFRRKI